MPKNMHILFISNSYPPAGHGGYELWCQEIAAGFTQRGHQVSVLTSRSPGINGGASQERIPIYRLLNLEVENGLASTVFRLLGNQRLIESKNLERTRQLILSTDPDVALIWGMWNVPRSVPALIEDLLPGRVVYYLCDYWPSLPSAYVQRLQAPARRGIARAPKRLVSRPLLARLQKDRPIQLAFDNPICVSERVREILVHDGFLPSTARVIHGGIQSDEFSRANGRRSKNARSVLKMIYVGRLEPEKGIHTAIHALALSVRHENGRKMTLKIVGSGDRKYETQLRQLVHDLDLDDSVEFSGWHPHSELPDIMAKHDALIFPSEWEEPFAKTVLEAMSAGLIVIGSRGGGTDEVLVEGVTGLTFSPGDAQSLADQISRLGRDANLRSRLAEAGRRRVAKEFTFDRMADRLEAALAELVVPEAAGARNG